MPLWIHTGYPVEIGGLSTETGPVLEKGQVPFGKKVAKATQNGNHDLVHVRFSLPHHAKTGPTVQGLQHKESPICMEETMTGFYLPFPPPSASPPFCLPSLPFFSLPFLPLAPSTSEPKKEKQRFAAHSNGRGGV